MGTVWDAWRVGVQVLGLVMAAAGCAFVATLHGPDTAWRQQADDGIFLGGGGRQVWERERGEEIERIARQRTSA